ncbi:MAG: alpha/beta fold hydrolase [Polyangiales bacterium]
MAQLTANGLQIEYDTFGDPDADPILLIMGLGTQMIAWPPAFCNALAEAGHFVVRFDNRDVGLSDKLDGIKAPGPIRFLLNRIFGLALRAPYTLDDMAADAVGVLDGLEIPAAHVVGASMGGMIAQIVAASHASRVKTLTSIMSSSGDPDLPGARREITKHLFSNRPKSNETDDLVEYLLQSFHLLMSPEYPRTDGELRPLIIENLERSHYPEGFKRQLAAIVADGSRVERLSTIEAPTLVIHGKEDPLIPVECGFSTALHVRGAKLELIDGMGHDLPPLLLAPIASMIIEHVSSRGRRRSVERDGDWLEGVLRPEVRFEIIEHGGETYLAGVRLRDEILQNPEGVVTTEQDMTAERALIHVAGFVGAELCATCVLVSEGEAVRMKRVAVAPTFQSRGVGTAMLRFCEQRARTMGAGELYARARHTAVRFYEKAGYSAEGDYFDEVGIPHIIVRRKLGETVAR